MTGKIALCADEQSLRNPQLLGLSGERLDAQGWLVVFSKGAEARALIASTEEIEEVWVASSEDVEAINLAATLKSDNPNLPVRLIDFSKEGSLLSRAHTAAIDEVLDAASFPERYGASKARLGAPARTAHHAQRGASTSLAPLALVAEEELSLVAGAKPEQGALVQARFQPMAATRRGKGFVMPVVSGSGGAGKSSVSVMAAIVARDRGFKTLLLDYDLQFGDMAALAGVPDALAVDEAIGHPERLEREIGKGLPLTVLAAPARMEMAEAVVRAMPELLDRLSDAFDVVVANTGAAWAEQHAVLLERSSAALFLVDQRASSVRACKHALELCARCGIATGPFRFAVNRCAKGAPLTPVDVSSALEGAAVMELRDGGRDVEDYLGSGSADELMAMGNEFCESVAQAIGQLLPEGTRSPAGPERAQDGLFARRRGRHAGRKRGRKQ